MSRGEARPNEKVGEDNVGRLGIVVKSALTRAGLDSETANRYSFFCMEIYRFILKYPESATAIKGAKDTFDVFDGSKKAFKAAKYIESGAAVGVSSAKVGFTAYGASGGAGVLQVFVDRFEAFAKNQGIELNDCSLAVAKVSLDIAAAGIGTVTALSGFGLVVAGLGVLATARDSYVLGRICIAGTTPR